VNGKITESDDDNDDDEAITMNHHNHLHLAFSLFKYFFLNTKPTTEFSSERVKTYFYFHESQFSGFSVSKK